MNTMTLTLDDANNLLKEHGIKGCFSRPQFERALHHHHDKRIRDAITRAKKEPGALRFVENLLTATDCEHDRSAVGAAHSEPAETRPLDTTDARPTQERGAFVPPLMFKVYGKKSALEFREHTATKNYDTVIIEAAGATGPRQYDWSNKIAVQVMARELPAVASVLSGLIPKCEFTNHGPGKNKGYSIEAQGGAFFVRVFQSGNNKVMHAVPMPAEDSFYVNAMVLRQLSRAVPNVDGSLVGAALRAYARIATKS